MSRILKCMQYDMLSLKPKVNQIYFCVNTQLLYKDYGASLETRRLLPARVLQTENERTNNIKPILGKMYYVVETNNLWQYDGRWILKIGDTINYNSYSTYNGTLSPVINTDSNITNSQGDKIIDNNGLLGNGSVAIRDSNRIIRSTIEMNNINQRIDFKSNVNNGFLFIPNNNLPYSDLSKAYGALHLTTGKYETNSSIQYKGEAYYYGNWYNNGDIYVLKEADTSNVQVDYTPINGKEMLKYYITSNSTREIENETTEVTNYISIRPISDSQGMIQIIVARRDDNSVVINDIGELIYTNNGTLIENNIMYSNRKTYITQDGTHHSDYYLDQYGESILLQSLAGGGLTVTLPEIFYDESELYTIESKFYKQYKVLTEEDLETLNK